MIIKFNHPLLEHRISKLRKIDTDPDYFKRLIKKITALITVFATQDLEMLEHIVQTPLESMISNIIKEKVVAIPILRAGLGMIDVFTEVVPNVKVGFAGMYRDPKTLKPVWYYNNIPPIDKDTKIYILDPMLATGGSAIETVRMLIDEHNAIEKNISFITIVSAPEGIAALDNTYNKIKIYAGSIDRELNSYAYILPGLGDAGDRIYGTISDHKVN